MIKSLYVHIPFCVKKCLYCDFNSYSNNSIQNEYIDALLEELSSIEIKEFETIFVGGGTPTILSIQNMDKLLKQLNRFNPKEYTFEANPGTLSEEKLKLMKDGGVNRLSIGLQAWQDRLLNRLGRIHTLKEFLNNYYMARKHGFKNINIDLMFAIPEQTFEDWVETIENVLSLKPEHLSCYSLIIEEETPFFEMNQKKMLKLPEEEVERKMYKYAINVLQGHGLNRYEISNFALSGYECRHNITYWMDEEYIGCGAGAHSFFNKKRYYNFKGISEYIKGVKNGNTIEEKTELTLNDEMSEFMFLGLRMCMGIEKRRFKKRFGVEIEEVYSREINDLIHKGLLIDNGEFIRLTDAGIDLSNQVFVSFLR
jgi:oxygen-independent coproporphyrinogen-3 oxidase